ncbi:MAG: response regulator transcription factor [Alphaproteobacteria bacterium]|nr:response regulator transcription factor [Alphaproteobacteria bacterium]
MPRIIVVEDEPSLRTDLVDYLRSCGYDADGTGLAKGLAPLLAERPTDIVILDIMLPDIDGFETCRRIRATSDVPILMLTAKGEETDRIVGLELGADDYLPKPFNPRELLARIKAILRRRQGGRSDGDRVLRFGRLEIDPGSRQVRLDGQERQMTSHQFDLLVALAGNAGRVLSREQLMDLVRGEEFDAFDRSIDVHVSRIRAAVEDDPKHPRRIITVRGAGYVFARQQDGQG